MPVVAAASIAACASTAPTPLNGRVDGPATARPIVPEADFARTSMSDVRHAAYDRYAVAPIAEATR